MLVYIFVFLFFWAGVEAVSNNAIKKISHIVLYSLIFLFVGFRYEVGGDWFNYLDIYTSINRQEVNFWGTDYIYNILNYILPSYQLVNAVCAAISLFFFYRTLLNYKVSNHSFILCCAFLPFIILFTGFTRQAVAVSILMYLFSAPMTNKKNLLLGSLALGFHSSSIALFIVRLGFSIRGVLLLSAFIVLLFTFFLNRFKHLFNLYVENGTAEVVSEGVLLRLVFFIPIWFVLFYGGKNLNVKSHIKSICYISILITVVAFFYSTISDRFFYYIYFILLPFFHSYILNYRLKKLFYIFSAFISLAIFFIWYKYSYWASCCWIDYKVSLFSGGGV